MSGRFKRDCPPIPARYLVEYTTGRVVSFDSLPDAQRFQGFIKELKARPLPKDPIAALEISLWDRQAENARRERERRTVEELNATKFRLEEITAHRDHLVNALEDKQQELADCRAKRKVG